MIAQELDKRPECKVILDKFDGLSIDAYILANNSKFQSIINSLKTHPCTFFYSFYETQLLHYSIKYNIVDQVGNYNKIFTQESQIGTGGYGTVYKVKNKNDHKIYAIKIQKLNGMKY